MYNGFVIFLYKYIYYMSFVSSLVEIFYIHFNYYNVNAPNFQRAYKYKYMNACKYLNISSKDIQHKV